MKETILKILKNTDAYVSGQELCETLQVSRTAIWKSINQLKETGYEIEAISNKGYHLISCPDIITDFEIESNITTQLGKHVKYYDKIDSTNTQAKRLAEEGAEHGLLVVTEQQSAGKGRRGKGWESPSGTGIWFSLILKPDIEPSKASILTLIAALSVSKGIEKETGLCTNIKWPNDIVINKKKVCGILTEMSSELDYIHYIIVGMGINVNMEYFPEDIAAMATSLYLEKKKESNRAEVIKIRRSLIIKSILESMEEYYSIFLKTKSLEPFMEEYNQRLVSIQKEVKLIGENQTEQVGKCLGINKWGELRVQFKDGTIKEILSGEVSVRGLYGYV